jgi:hypothetical protein
MGKQCNSIVIPWFGMAESPQFSITLPAEAVEIIEKGLIPSGLWGTKRGTVCSALILDMLKRPEVREIAREHMSKKAKA